MELTEQDKSLPHQIQLVFASKFTHCVSGERVWPSDVAVTCNCYRKGKSDSFGQYIAPAPNVKDAWAAWNNPQWHQDMESFVPKEKK